MPLTTAWDGLGMGQDDIWSNICHFYELTVILRDFY